ncbi:MAG: 50S ribosomal protein L9 [Lachnospiraceae bacterium]|nr:50S ribosomal protein L9 [Lachnospiraceae bacterium]MDE5819556.1 50S ribosomal protein L9 [Lachnospiraceae bacterium]
MKVILQQDVKALGKKGDLVEVSDGYARNFILPKKIGVEANNANINDLKLRKANEEKIAAENLAKAQEFKKTLEDKVIAVSIKAGEGGKVFGAVTGKEIAQAAKEQYGYDIDKKKIVLKDSIKNFGTYEVPLKLHPKVTATLRVQVSEK